MLDKSQRKKHRQASSQKRRKARAFRPIAKTFFSFFVILSLVLLGYGVWSIYSSIQTHLRSEQKKDTELLEAVELQSYWKNPITNEQGLPLDIGSVEKEEGLNIAGDISSSSNAKIDQQGFQPKQILGVQNAYQPFQSFLDTYRFGMTKVYYQEGLLRVGVLQSLEPICLAGVPSDNLTTRLVQNLTKAPLVKFLASGDRNIDRNYIEDFDQYWSGDHLVYRISLREDLHWSDGSRLTADDYIAGLTLPIYSSFSGILNISLPYAEDILGFDDFQKDVSTPFIGVKKIDERTFSIELTQLASRQYDSLRVLDFNPIPVKKLFSGFSFSEDEEGVRLSDRLLQSASLEKALKQSTYLQSGLTAGAYYLTASFYEGNEFYLQRNPYANVQNDDTVGNIQKLEVRRVWLEDIPSILKKGNLDLVQPLDTDLVDQTFLKALSGNSFDRDTFFSRFPNSAEPVALSLTQQMIYFYSKDFYDLLFVCNQAPTDSTRFRMAMASLLDKKTIFKELSEHTGIAYSQSLLLPVSLSSARYLDNAKSLLPQLDSYDFDLERASTLLSKAGFKYTSQGEVYEINDDDTLDDTIRFPAQAAQRYTKSLGEYIPCELNLAYEKDDVISQHIASNLEKNAKRLGVVVTVQPLEKEAFEKAMRAQAPDDSLIDFSENPDEQVIQNKGLVKIFVRHTKEKDDQENYLAYSNASENLGRSNLSWIDSDELARTARQLYHAPNSTAHNKSWRLLNYLINEKLPVLPVLARPDFVFSSSRLQDFKLQDINHWGNGVIKATVSYSQLLDQDDDHPPVAKATKVEEESFFEKEEKELDLEKEPETLVDEDSDKPNRSVTEADTTEVDTAEVDVSESD